jgi:hypothetical protein
MFIGAEKRLDVGFHVAQARLESLARGGLLHRASHDAYGQWETGLARLSPLNAAPAISKLVAVRFRDMMTHEDSVLWTMRWEAIDPGGTLIPALMPTSGTPRPGTGHHAGFVGGLPAATRQHGHGNGPGELAPGRPGDNPGLHQSHRGCHRSFCRPALAAGHGRVLPEDQLGIWTDHGRWHR